MAKISQYAPLTSPAPDDLLPVVDVEDDTMASSGTTKNITIADLFDYPTVNPGDGVMRLLIPMYIYPSYFDEGGGAWQQVQSACPAASIVIANVASGPGASINGDFTTQIPLAQAAGLTVLGYVPTNYGATSAATVEGQVDDWYSWYSVDGIFFDEASTSPGTDQAYYQGLYNYVKAKPASGRLVVINPGSPTDVSYMTACDIVCDFEDDANTFLTEFTPEAWAADYPADRFCRTINSIDDGATLGAIIAQLRSQRSGYCFITTNDAYSSLPADPYWTGQLWQASSLTSYPVAGAEGSTAQTLTTGSTVTITGLGVARVTSSAAVTGIIMPAGTAAAQQVTVINEGSHPVAFAASGTSAVADGISDVIAPATSSSYTWDSGTSLWYRSASGVPPADWINVTGPGYGADPTGTNYSDTAFANMVTNYSSTGQPGYIPAGTYKIQNPLNWKVAGLVVYTDGPANVTITQVTGNTPILQLAGEGQVIGGMTLRYASQQPSTSTSAVGIELGDDTIGDCFLSEFHNLRVWLAATGIAINPAITTKAGMFSCSFLGLTEVFGYSISAVSLVGGNAVGAGGTGFYMQNLYTHNNFSGSDANCTSHVVNIQNYEEATIDVLNIEHGECFNAVPLQVAEVGNVTISSLHIEHIELSGTSPGWGLVGVGTQTGMLLINGYAVRFCTFTGTTSNAMIQITGSGGGQTVIVNGFSSPTSDGGDSTTTLALVDFASFTDASATICGINPRGPLATTNAINAGAGSQLVINDGAQVTYAPAIPWTTFATGGGPNLLNVSSGGNTTPTAGQWYYADLFIPFTVTLTGIIAGCPSGGGTDKWIAAIFPAAGGAALANSATAGVTTPSSGTNSNFKLPFTATVTLPGPAVYKAALQSNGTGAKFEAFDNAVEGFVTGIQSGSFGTIPSLSPGSTYNVNTGPMLKTY